MPTWAENEVLKQLRRIEAGEVDVLAGCRAVVPLLSSLPQSVARSPSASALVAVVSETDDFPDGRTRGDSSTEVLVRADADLAVYVALVRDVVLDACRELSVLVQQDGGS